MSNNVIALIPQIEFDLIEAYLINGSPKDFEDYLSQNEIPKTESVSQLQIAVARVILNPIQASLPQWAAVKESGEVLLNRKSGDIHRPRP